MWRWSVLVKRVLFPKKFTGNFEGVFTALQIFSIQKQPSGGVVNKFSKIFQNCWLFITDRELLKRNIFKVWFDLKKLKGSLFPLFKSSCIANKYVVFRWSVGEIILCCNRPRYYTSLMDVAQNLIFITSYYIYFKLLMILFSFNDVCWEQHSFVKPC